MRTLPALAATTLAIISLAGAAAAQDDRYGPPPAWLEHAQAPAPYRGPFLTWAGKTAPPPSAPAPPTPSEAHVAAMSAYASGVGAPHWFARPSQAHAPPPPDAPAPQPPTQAYAPPPRAYVARPPADAPPPQASWAGAPARPSYAAPSAPPAQTAAAPSPPVPAPQAAASERTSVRFYSLHRAYGLTPDPDPKPTGNPLVLIAPTQAARDDGEASDDSSEGAKHADHADAQGGAS